MSADPSAATSLFAQARQGQPAAIAQLMNRQLQAHDIMATVFRQSDGLHILLVGTKVPPIEPSVTFVRQGLMRVAIATEYTVHIQGQAIGAAPAWTETLTLAPAVTPPPAIAMSPPDAAPPTRQPPAKTPEPALTTTESGAPPHPAVTSLLLSPESPERLPQPWLRPLVVGSGILIPVILIIFGTVRVTQSFSRVFDTAIEMGQSQWESLVYPTRWEEAMFLPVEHRLYAMLMAEQAYFTEYGEFTINTTDLLAGLNLEAETDYTYRIELGRDVVDIIAQPRRADLMTYSGSVFVFDGDFDNSNSFFFETILCKTLAPSTTVPKAMYNEAQQLVCPPGSTPVS